MVYESCQISFEGGIDYFVFADLHQVSAGTFLEIY